MHRDRGVGHQRPRGGSPDQQVHARLSKRTGGHREPDVHRRIDHVRVSLRDLVVGQGCFVTRAVRGDPVVFDEQPLVEDLLEGPPDALDVGGVHGAVGVVQIAPVAHALGHPGEVGDVTQHRLAAAGIELGDAEVLDVALAGETQLLFYGELDGQAVAVPAGAARNMKAPHRAEAGEEVLEDARLDVMGARPAVGGRGTLVEDPPRPVRGRVQGTLEDLQILPAREHLAFGSGQVDLGRQRWEHRCRLGGLSRLSRLGGLSRLGRLGRHGRSPSGSSSNGGTTPRGTRRSPGRGGTAVPPSLPPGTPVCGGLGDHSSPAVPDLLGAHRPCSPGGSGVIFTARWPPGLHRPRLAGRRLNRSSLAAPAATCPVNAVRCNKRNG